MSTPNREYSSYYIKTSRPLDQETEELLLALAQGMLHTYRSSLRRDIIENSCTIHMSTDRHQVTAGEVTGFQFDIRLQYPNETVDAMIVTPFILIAPGDEVVFSVVKEGDENRERN